MKVNFDKFEAVISKNGIEICKFFSPKTDKGFSEKDIAAVVEKSSTEFSFWYSLITDETKGEYNFRVQKGLQISDCEIEITPCAFVNYPYSGYFYSKKTMRVSNA